MGKLLVLSGQQICDILSRKGFIEIRRRGSHIVMQNRLPQCTITIPLPDHQDERIGTLQSIIRQAGISRVNSNSILNVIKQNKFINASDQVKFWSNKTSG